MVLFGFDVWLFCVGVGVWLVFVVCEYGLGGFGWVECFVGYDDVWFDVFVGECFFDDFECGVVE